MHHGAVPEALILSARASSSSMVVGTCVARSREGGLVVEHQALDVHRHRDAVVLAADGRRIQEAGHDAGLELCHVEDVVQRLKLALLLEVLQQTRLREERDVGRVVACHAASDQRVERGRRDVLDLDAVRLGPGVKRVLEPLRLVTTEAEHDRHRLLGGPPALPLELLELPELRHPLVSSATAPTVATAFVRVKPRMSSLPDRRIN